MQLRGISEHRRQLSRHADAHLDALRERPLDDLFHFLEQPARRQGDSLALGAFGERQQVAHHLGRVIGAVLDGVERLMLRRVLLLQQIERQQDGSERVVEIVRDAPGESSD